MPRGRPPKWKNAEAMQEVIDAYFKRCDGESLIVDGEPVMDKRGNVIMTKQHPPTVTGLARALDLSSRRALMNYQKKAEFSDTIARAKLRCEEYAEERLFGRDRQRGAIFLLKCGFRWNEDGKDGAESDNSAGCGVVELPAVMDALELSPEQRYAAFVSGMNDASAPETKNIAPEPVAQQQESIYAENKDNISIKEEVYDGSPEGAGSQIERGAIGAPQENGNRPGVQEGMRGVQREAGQGAPELRQRRRGIERQASENCDFKSHLLPASAVISTANDGHDTVQPEMQSVSERAAGYDQTGEMGSQRAVRGGQRNSVRAGRPEPDNGTALREEQNQVNEVPATAAEPAADRSEEVQREITQEQADSVEPRGTNYVIPESGLKLPNGEKARFKANIAAIKTPERVSSFWRVRCSHGH